MTAPAPAQAVTAPFGRRLLALLIDWLACLAITYGLLGQVMELTEFWRSFAPLAILFVENLLLVATAGGALGHRLLGLAVLPTHREAMTWSASAIRAALLCLFIPAIVMDGEGRGLHDRAAGTSVVRG